MHLAPAIPHTTDSPPTPSRGIHPHASRNRPAHRPERGPAAPRRGTRARATPAACACTAPDWPKESRTTLLKTPSIDPSAAGVIRRRCAPDPPRQIRESASRTPGT
ncbi:MAG: hypothetical protein EA376_09485 [Phycisphaeraceae bacterium]|nr:MAG: hypothetical protein EA376_09485 [Phycisphaeraceae bacterium]